MSTLTATPDTSSSDTIPATMRAAVYRGVNDVHVETVPVPEIGAGEVLIKVASCGICGTDLKKIHAFSGMKLPGQSLQQVPALRASNLAIALWFSITSHAANAITAARRHTHNAPHTRKWE